MSGSSCWYWIWNVFTLTGAVLINYIAPFGCSCVEGQFFRAPLVASQLCISIPNASPYPQIFFFSFLKLSLFPIVLMNVGNQPVGPGLPYMGVLTQLHMSIQSVSLNVENCIHKFLLPLCPGKPATTSTFCMAKIEALHFSREAPQSWYSISHFV